jgi:hypothetical protein
MRVLSDGRPRANTSGFPLALFLSGICALAFVGGFVVVRALVEWLT